MAEYIEKETLIKRLNDFKEWCKDGRLQGAVFAIDVIKDIPAADVQPVKREHWYHNTSKYISELDAYFIQACCSCCGKYSDRVDSYSQLMSNAYCSHCGARMDR